MTSIEWTQRPGTRGETWNPLRARIKGGTKTGWFCEHVTEGCRNCYAEAMNAWRGNGLAYKAQNRGKLEIFLDEKTLQRPLHWRAPRTVFPCSMTDLYADFVPDEMLDRIFAVMALTPQHSYLPLTKRPARARAYMTSTDLARCDGRGEAVMELAGKHHPDPDLLCLEGFGWPLPNLWLGVSCHDQASADQAVPLLLETPAALRFVSYEPALGPVNFNFVGEGYDGVDALNGPPDLQPGECLDWVIAGGESGPNARPAHPDWFRNLRDQCQGAGVPFFFKQWGAWRPSSAGGDGMQRVGKKAAGRRLDGAEHDAFPESAP